MLWRQTCFHTVLQFTSVLRAMGSHILFGGFVFVRPWNQPLYSSAFADNPITLATLTCQGLGGLKMVDHETLPSQGPQLR